MGFKTGDSVQVTTKDPFGGNRISGGIVGGSVGPNIMLVNTALGVAMMVQNADMVAATQQVSGDMQALKEALPPVPPEYQDGYDTGYKSGYDAGYKMGYDAGYKTGYDAGYNDGLKASSPAPTPTSTGVI